MSTFAALREAVRCRRCGTRRNFDMHQCNLCRGWYCATPKQEGFKSCWGQEADLHNSRSCRSPREF